MGEDKKDRIREEGIIEKQIREQRGIEKTG